MPELKPQYEQYGRPIYINYRRLFEELKSGIDGPFTLALLAGNDSPPENVEWPNEKVKIMINSDDHYHERMPVWLVVLCMVVVIAVLYGLGNLP